jgi:hypothetical protein
MNVVESKSLKRGTRICWNRNGADSGTVTGTTWDSVTIAWDDGQIAMVHHGDMRNIMRLGTKPKVA